MKQNMSDCKQSHMRAFKHLTGDKKGHKSNKIKLK